MRHRTIPITFVYIPRRYIIIVKSPVPHPSYSYQSKRLQSHASRSPRRVCDPRRLSSRGDRSKKLEPSQVPPSKSNPSETSTPAPHHQDSLITTSNIPITVPLLPHIRPTCPDVIHAPATAPRLKVIGARSRHATAVAGSFRRHARVGGAAGVVVMVVVMRASLVVGDRAGRVVVAAHFVAVFARGGDEAHGRGSYA